MEAVRLALAREGAVCVAPVRGNASRAKLVEVRGLGVDESTRAALAAIE
jgi:hypothetical protein